MPDQIYSVQAPDGKIYDVQGPVGASQQDVINAVLAQNPAAGMPPKPIGGLRGELGAATERTGSELVAGIQSLLGNRNQAAEEALRREESIGKRYETESSLEKIKKAYNAPEGGLFAAARTAAGEVPATVASMAPGLAEMAGLPLVGTLVGGPIFGATIGAGLGAGLQYVQSIGSGVTGQAAQQQKEGKPVDVSVGKAAAYAIPETALNYAHLAPLGAKAVGKIFGPTVTKLLDRGLTEEATAAAQAKLADDGFWKTVAKGTAEGAAINTPLMVAQTALARAQSGQELFSPDAYTQYGSAATSGVLGAPLGMVGSFGARGAAREAVGARQALADAEAAKTRTEQEAATKAQQLQDPEYHAQVTQQYEDLQKKFSELKAAKDVKVEDNDFTGKEAKDEARRAFKEFMNSEETRGVIDKYREIQQNPITSAAPPTTEVPKAPSMTTDVQQAMDTHKLLQQQLTPLQDQFTKAAQAQDTNALRTLRPQIEALKTKIDESAANIEKLGGSVQTSEELETAHQAALSNVDKSIQATHKKLVEAAQAQDLEATDKHSATLDDLKQQREKQIADYTKRQQALAKNKADAEAEFARRQADLENQDVGTIPNVPEGEPNVTSYLQDLAKLDEMRKQGFDEDQIEKMRARMEARRIDTSRTDQGLLFPETAESRINVGGGKAPEKTRAQLVQEFQAAKQARDRLGMQNAIEQMRVMAERSKARSEAARGIGPKGELTDVELAKQLAGTGLTATGAQAETFARTFTPTDTTPESLRAQIAAMPHNLPDHVEKILDRVVRNFNEFASNKDRANMLAEWLHKTRTAQLHPDVIAAPDVLRERTIVNELDKLDYAKRQKQRGLFTQEEAPMPVTDAEKEALATPPKVERPVTQVERENADAAKRKEENERNARLATIPGESISFEAHKKALAVLDDVTPRIQELTNKAGDESLPKTTRDKANRELKKLELAKKFLRGSTEGNNELRLQAEEELAKLRVKIKNQEALVAENPISSRKQELAKSQRREKELTTIIRGFGKRAERTPIETTHAKEKAAAENMAREFLERTATLEQDETLGKLPPRVVGPMVRREVTAGDVRTGNLETVGERELGGSNPARQAGQVKGITPKEAVESANKIAAEKIAAREPLTEEEVNKLNLDQHLRLFDAAQSMRRNLERNLAEVNEKIAFSEKTTNPKLKDPTYREDLLHQKEMIESDLKRARANEDALGALYSEEEAKPEPTPAPKPKAAPAAKKTAPKVEPKTEPKVELKEEITPVEVSTSAKTGNTKKSYEVFDDNNDRITLNIVRDSDGKLFRIFAETKDENGKLFRVEFDTAYGESITDSYIVKFIAEPIDWTLTKKSDITGNKREVETTPAAKKAAPKTEPKAKKPALTQEDIDSGVESMGRAIDKQYNTKMDPTHELHGKTYSEAALIGAKNARNPLTKTLFNILAEVLKSAPTSDMQGRVFVTSEKGKYTAKDGKPGLVTGHYDPAKNYVLVPSAKASKNATNVLLHELLHAATSRGILTDANLNRRITEMRNTVTNWLNTAEGKKYYREKGNWLKTNVEGYKAYGLTNNHEFLAEVFSNKQFQDLLQQIPSITPKQSIYTRLVNAFATFLRFVKPEERSLLHDALEITDEMMEHTEKVNAMPVDWKTLRHDEPVGADADVFNAPPEYAEGFSKAGALAKKVVSTEKSLTERYNGMSFGHAGLEFMTKMVDQFAPLAKASKLMDSLSGTQMMHDLRMVGQRMNLLGQVVGHGPLQRMEITRADGKKEWVYQAADGANLVNVNKLLSNANNITGGQPATNSLFSLYSIARRAERVGLDKLNYDKAVTAADLKAAMDEIRAKPGLEKIFNAAHDEYQKFNHGLINFAVKARFLSKDVAAKMLSSADYVPYYREKANGEVALMMGNEEISRIGNIKGQPYLHELVGGNERIMDFNTAAVRNANMLLEMGLRNQAALGAAYNLRDIGMAVVGKGTASGKNVFNFKKDGEAYHAMVKDSGDIPADLLVKGMEGIPVQTSSLLRIMGLPGRLVRSMFTANPVSAGRILFKDTLSSAMTAGSNFDSIGAAFKNVGDNLMERRGLSGGEVFQGLPEDMSKILREVQSGKPGWETLLAKAHVLHAKADAATRQIRYESYRKQGLSDMEASYMALESMNFTKRGISPSIHVLNTLNPFINSQIQGINTLVQALRGNMPFNEKLKIREKIFQRGMLVAGGTMLYAAMMQDDKAYKNALPDQKYNNWFVGFPGLDEPVRVPIPFEAGMLFKAVPEALVNAMYGKGEDAAEGMRLITQKMIPGGDTLGIPLALRPGIEAYMNKSFFTGRDLESKHEQAMQPGYRTRQGTSPFADALGEELDVSPIKIDHLLQGYTGGLGLAIMNMASHLVFGKENTGPEAKLSGMPIIGSTFQPEDAGGIVEQAYKTMTDISRVQATYKDLLAKDPAKAEAYKNRYAEEFNKAGLASGFTSTMNSMNQQRTAVMASKTMTPAEKRAWLTDWQARRTAFAERQLAVARP
jgi:hypothetical protein